MSTAIKIRCVGTGDAFGSGGRLNSCFHVTTGGKQLLLDCGCSSLIGLQRCGLSPAAIDTVIVSHLHGDHFGGIPFLILEAKYVSGRQRPLTLMGPAGLRLRVEAACEALYPGVLEDKLNFPVIYQELNPEQTIEQGSVSITCDRVKHGKSPDVFAIRLQSAGKSLCYSGDTEWTDTLLPLAADADLLIVECCAYQQQVPSHLDYQTLLAQRKNLTCKRLVLTHMGPEMLAKIETLELETVNDGDLILL